MHIEPALSVSSGIRPRGASERLREAMLELAHGKATITRHTERGWASITFAGSRHRFTLLFEGSEAVERGESFIADLPEHEFTLRKQIVAEATVVAVDHQIDPPRMEVSAELLLLDED